MQEANKMRRKTLFYHPNIILKVYAENFISQVQNNLKIDILTLDIPFIEGVSESPTTHIFIRISATNIFSGEAIGFNWN